MENQSLSEITIENCREFVVGIDKKVPVLNRGWQPSINFDNAASTPTLRPVLESINEFMKWYSSIHRGTGYKSQLCSYFYDTAREVVARFVGADPDRDVVIFGKNATEAINKLSFRLNLTRDDLVLVSKMEHHSNDLPWRARARVIHVDVDDEGRLRLDDLLEKLKTYSRQIKLFAVTGASNVTGWVNDVHRLAEMVHEFGVPIMVDAAQLAPHRKIDMKPHGDPRHIDFLAFSAHKMYAPFGTGVLIGPRTVFDAGDPEYVGGGTVKVVGFDYVHWDHSPERDEAGTPNTVGVIALARVIHVLEKIGMDQLAHHEAQLTRYALKRLAEVPGLTIYGGKNPEEVDHRLGVITFNVGDLPHGLVAAILSHEAGIAVRNGCFCAHPYLKTLMKLDEDTIRRFEQEILENDKSNMPGAVRVSFGMYNNEQEIDRLIDILNRIARREWEGEYVQNPTTGEYFPKGFEPQYEKHFNW